MADAKHVSVTPHAAEDVERPEASEEEDSDDDEPPPDFYKTLSTKSRGSVSAEAYGDWNAKGDFTAVVIEKSPEQTERLRGCLLKSFLFAGLEDRDLEVVIGAMREVNCEPGQVLITQGEDGDCLYVVETGRFDCKIIVEGGSELVVKTCEAGDVFGELALLYNCPRAATVVSAEAGLSWQLDRETFNHIVKDGAQQKRARHEEFLAKVPVLESMSGYERSQLADALRKEVFDVGQTVVTQGELGKRFYLVEAGEAVAIKDGEEVMTYTVGGYFGELALIRDQPRATTVTAKGPLKLLSIDSKSFNRLLNTDMLAELAGRYS
jgi:cAMP-dependent protein kinase regulator